MGGRLHTFIYYVCAPAVSPSMKKMYRLACDDIRQVKTFLFIVSPGIKLQEESVYSKAVVICLYCERFAGKFDVDSSRNRIDTSPEKRRTV